MNTNGMSLVAGLVPLLLALGLIADARPTYAQAATSNGAAAVTGLSIGPWILNDARDWFGNNLDGSTLTLNLQTPTHDGLQVEGYIDWRLNGAAKGRQSVNGSFIAATRELYLKTQMQLASGERLVRIYWATLSADGRALSGGRWAEKVGDNGVMGSWVASIQPSNSTASSGAASTQDTRPHSISESDKRLLEWGLGEYNRAWQNKMDEQRKGW